MWWSPGGSSSRTTRCTRLWISRYRTSLQGVKAMSSGVTRAVLTALTVVNIVVTLPTLALAQDSKPICPDRPGRGTSACTVDAGHAQLELGLFDDSLQHRSGVTPDPHQI